MKIIEPYFEFLEPVGGAALLRKIELSGRVCYKSEAAITPDSATAFVRRIVKSGHESVLEHATVSVRVVCDRGVTHEIVRHRIASYSQESTRYCNYTGEKFGGELVFIKPCYWQESGEQYARWQRAMQAAEDTYLALVRDGATPQEARSVLPNSLKTELVMTMNLREWRHFFRLRAAKGAHPQMIEIAAKLLAAFQAQIPVVFDDLI